MQFVKHIFINGLGYVKLSAPKPVPSVCSDEIKKLKKLKELRKKKNESNRKKKN